MATDVPARTEIPIESTWDVHNVFPSDNAWNAEIEHIQAALAGFERFQGHLSDGASTLADWLESVQDVDSRTRRVFLYASMQHDVDTANAEAQARADRALGLWGRVLAAQAFADPEILSLGWDTVNGWVEQDSRLQIFAHWFDDLQRRQEHVRSAEVEEILGLVQDPFHTASSTHRTLTDTDLTFTPARTRGGDTIAVAQGNLGTLLSDPDREVRRTAWENFSDAHLAFKNTAATCLIAGVKQDVFMARARRYGSSLKAALGENNVPESVFHNLINTYKQHLPVWHRYWRVRREGLGYDTLHEYDIKAPLAGPQPPLGWQQSIEWICQGMQPLGDEYVSILRRGVLDQRWVDVLPNRGKRSGAYSDGTQGTHPFILMSYENSLEDMSTLAHELGHSMHSYYTWRDQPFIYGDYSMFVAEVASNFNQALVRAHLLATNPDPDFQIGVIEEAMSNFHRYFFIMPTLARFELEIHQRAERDEGMPADALIDLMVDLFGEGYGDELAVDHDRTGITWAEFSGHLYANFYVYQYATGIAAANALAKQVLDEGPQAAERYLQFLKTGDSLYPLDALKLAGVDMTTPKPVEEAFGVMSGMVDRLEELLKQRSPSPA